MALIKKNIAKIIGLPGNDHCGDCHVAVDTNNGWSSMTFGTVICVECAGSHRSIPGNQIRSFLLDTKAWKEDKNVNFLSKIGGNIAANNNVWECHLPYFTINPKRDHFNKICDKQKCAKFRQLFVVNKYENQLFIPLSHSDYFTKKNKAIIKVPLDAMPQSHVYVYNIYGKKKWSKKALILSIHSNYLSIYSNNKIKKKKCDHIKTWNLIPLKITIHRADPYDDDEDCYEFQLMNDETKEDTEDIDNNDDDDDDIEPELRVRVKDFDEFIEIVEFARKQIHYYRMYSKLVPIESLKDPKVDINKDIQNTSLYIGCGKLFGSITSHFYVVSDELYVFKQPIDSPKNKGGLQALFAWNLQKIDVQQDMHGERTGIKCGVIIIEPYKMISIKFDDDKLSHDFYKELHKLWKEIRGNYYVDFKSKLPVILDENKEKDDNIQFHRSPRSSLKDHLDFSRVKSAALKHQRPPEILEILAKIENIEVEVMKPKPQPPPAEIFDESFIQMREMHRKMSSPMLVPQKAPSVAVKMGMPMPSINEKKKPQPHAHQEPKGIDAMDDLELDPPQSQSLPMAKGQSLPKIEQSLKANDNDKSALNSYQKAKIRQKRRRKQTEPPPQPQRERRKGMGNRSFDMSERLAQDDINSKFIAGMKNKNKGMKAMRPRNEKHNEGLPRPPPRRNTESQASKAVKMPLKPQKVIKMPLKPQKVPVPSHVNAVIAVKNEQNPPPNPVALQRLPLVQSKSSELKNEHVAAKDMNINKGNMKVNDQIKENNVDKDNGKDGDGWSCSLCTFSNVSTHLACDMCGSERQGDAAKSGFEQNNVQNERERDSIDDMYRQQEPPQPQPPQAQPQQGQGQGQGQDPHAVMLFHQQEFQKYFQQQQFPGNGSQQDQLQMQQMANFHYQRYMMLYNQHQEQQRQQALGGVNYGYAQQQQKKVQQRPKVPNRNRKLLQKRKSGVRMQYVKVERYFLMNDEQKQYFAGNSYALQTALSEFCRLEILSDIQCYKLLIPMHIPLPKRKAYWQNILKVTREHIGMSMEHIV